MEGVYGSTPRTPCFDNAHVVYFCQGSRLSIFGVWENVLVSLVWWRCVVAFFISVFGSVAKCRVVGFDYVCVVG